MTRQLTREIETVRDDRTRVRNRIQGLLATQGVRLALDAAFRGGARDGADRRWPAVSSGAARSGCCGSGRICRYRGAAGDAGDATRDERSPTGTERVAEVARRLLTLRGVGEASAATFSAELFGTRTFRERPAARRTDGLVPVPYRSDQRVQDQGISKAGRGEFAALGDSMAWGWVRWQPDSALTQWFERRFAGPANAHGGSGLSRSRAN